MSSMPRRILLTGATGMLGRYLLRDLLAAGCHVTVLARDSRKAKAADRIGEIVQFSSESLGHRLPEPTVVAGDIREENLGITVADRRWLAVSCDAVVHAAASLSFLETADGEPQATNVGGTRHLLDLCRRVGLKEMHFISTAFVCGQVSGNVLEDAVNREPRFHNTYERSKHQAEQLLREATDVRLTVYRPSVIVGDSRTGYSSSFTGIYRFLEFAAKLSMPVPSAEGTKLRLPVRMPLTGDEPRNLVPVDWVSQAIVRLVNLPDHHGRNYHLVASRPVPTRLIEEAAQIALKLEGVNFAGPDAWNNRSELEKIFLDHLAEYWPYMHGDPAFDSRNLSAALPDYPAASVDRDLLVRLIEFAVEDRWGRRQRSAAPKRVDCRQYIEEVFPERSRRSPLAKAANLNVAVGIDIRGPNGGEWTCHWIDGELVGVCRGISTRVDVFYHIDEMTFDDLINGRQSPPEAFFAKRIEVDGDVEKALKLAVLFGHFLTESPIRETSMEAVGALGRT